MTIAAETVRSAVQAYYASIGERNIDATASMFAPAAVMRDPVGIPPAVDDAARRQRYAGIAGAFTTFGITEDEVVVCADEAAVRWNARGTTNKGSEVQFGGISTFSFDGDGKIASMSAYYDIGAVMKAMQA